MYNEKRITIDLKEYEDLKHDHQVLSDRVATSDASLKRFKAALERALINVPPESKSWLLAKFELFYYIDANDQIGDKNCQELSPRLRWGITPLRSVLQDSWKQSSLGSDLKDVVYNGVDEDGPLVARDVRKAKR